MVSVGSIITGGFRLFREQPVAVVVWGLIYGVLTAGSSLFMASAMQGQLAAVQAGTGSPYAMLSWMIPGYIVMILVGLVMSAAAFRAVIRPEAKSAAFLRLGGDELRLFGLAIIWFVMNAILYFVLVMLLAVVAGGVIAAGDGRGVGAAFAIGFAIALPILALMIFIHIRLSPAIPLTILRRKIVIGEAWRLTKGNFWTLFAGYFVIVLLLIAGYLLVITVAMGPYFTSFAAGGFDPRGIQAAQQARLAQMTSINAMTVVGWVLTAVFGAISYALWAGSVGTATRELLGRDVTDYAETFA